MNIKACRRGAITLGVLFLMSTPAATQRGGQLTAVSRLQPGQWELRDLDNLRAPAKSLCITDPAIFMQIQHRSTPCSRLVIANEPRSATVHYTCPSSGFGRTRIRVETPRLATIDTQGIDQNIPFENRYVARRKGGCAR